ncbi:MAG: 30S ribosomal protein S8 [Planctomycetota bacterium]|nr:MAG: 30S ribosomal protein S8 [Planctomycetota bacterium]
MALSDPIADMLTRIRNAVRNRSKTTLVMNSKVNRGILDVLQREGYIVGSEPVDDGRQGQIRVQLKYSSTGEPLIRTVKRESKPGCRVYMGVDDLPRPMQGLGISIVSTSQGVMSDRMCRDERIGGEMLCTVD